MSILTNVLQAMQYGVEYDPATVAAICHIQEQEAGRYLHMLQKGGVVECTKPDRFRKNRKYSTKQKQLFS
jgi:hypothetical protein